MFHPTVVIPGLEPLEFSQENSLEVLKPGIWKIIRQKMAYSEVMIGMRNDKKCNLLPKVI